MQFGIGLHVPRHAAGREAQQVVIDEDLPVATGAGADADGGDLQLGRDPRGRGGGNALQHDAEGPGLLGRQRVGQQPLCRRAARDSRPVDERSADTSRNGPSPVCPRRPGPRSLRPAPRRLPASRPGSGSPSRSVRRFRSPDKRPGENWETAYRRPARHGAPHGRPSRRDRSSLPTSPAACWHGPARPSTDCRRPECPRCRPHRPVGPWHSRRR